MAQPRFGELLWQAVMQVKARKGRSITSIKRELAERCYVGVGAVEKWKKRSIPATETVEILARFGVREAGMERVWLRAFLRAGEYYDGGALEQELFGEQLFWGKAQCGNCHYGPAFVDDYMHDLKVERFYRGRPEGPIKTFPLRGIKDSPPYLHDDRLPTLDDAVEFFNLILELHLEPEEKEAITAYLLCL